MLLMEGVISGEERAFLNRMYEDYNKTLYYVAYRMLGNQTDAEDAVAQTYLRILEKIDRIRELPEEKRIAYCVTIVKNASTDILRLRKRVSSVEEVPEQDREVCSEMERRLLKSEELEKLFSVIEKLSEEERNLVILRYVYKMRFREIGQLLGVGESAAGKRCQQLVERLRALYEKEENCG